MKESCLRCGAPIRGRLDKKFCTDYCRSAYHNRKNRTKNKRIRKINGILRRNYRILTRSAPQTGKTLERNFLLQKGFNFYYFTHVDRMKDGAEYRFCYDLGYRELPDGNYSVISCRPKDG